jgi:hypothetical protein
LLRKAQMEGDAEFLKEGVRALSQALMEMEVEEHIEALPVTSVRPGAKVSATATARGSGTRGWEPLRSQSRG